MQAHLLPVVAQKACHLQLPQEEARLPACLLLARLYVHVAVLESLPCILGPNHVSLPSSVIGIRTAGIPPWWAVLEIPEAGAGFPHSLRGLSLLLLLGRCSSMAVVISCSLEGGGG